MRFESFLGALGVASFALGQGAMALGDCAELMSMEEHDAHMAMGHEMPIEDEHSDDGTKGCHACLRKRPPINSSLI